MSSNCSNTETKSKVLSLSLMAASTFLLAWLWECASSAVCGHHMHPSQLHICTSRIRQGASATPVGCSAIPEYSFTQSAVDAVVAVVIVSTHPRRVKLVTVLGRRLARARCWGFWRTGHSARPWHREDRHWPAAAQSLVHGSAQMVPCGSSSWYCKPVTAPSKVTRSVWWLALMAPQPTITPPPSNAPLNAAVGMMHSLHSDPALLAERCSVPLDMVILRSSVSVALSHWTWRSCTPQWALLCPTGHGDPALLGEHCSAHGEQAGELDQEQDVVGIGLAQANTSPRYQKGDGASRDSCWLKSVPQVLQWRNNPAVGSLFGGWMNSRTSCA